MTSNDSKVDAVGACVGVRGTRIKNIVDELGGERIDIVRWNESLQVLIPNALQPAEIDEVMLCHLLGRAIVLVRDDQLSLAIGRRGQNVRLASKLVGWDIEIMTAEELDEVIEKAVKSFEKIDAVNTELAERLVEQGILSYDDLSVMEIADLVNTIEGLTEEQAIEIVARAETLAEEQTEELPRRKGQRIAPEETVAPEASARRPNEDADDGTSADGQTAVIDSDGQSSGADRDLDGDAGSDFDLDIDSSLMSYDRAATETGSASPPDPADSTGGDSPTDESSDLERDEAIDEEFHDLALAVETSGISSQGHEVTFPPSEDDQGETLRIVTDAVEQGEGERLGGPSQTTSGDPDASSPGRPASSSPRPNRSQEEPNDLTGEVP